MPLGKDTTARIVPKIVSVCLLCCVVFDSANQQWLAVSRTRSSQTIFTYHVTNCAAKTRPYYSPHRHILLLRRRRLHRQCRTTPTSSITTINTIIIYSHHRLHILRPIVPHHHRRHRHELIPSPSLTFILLEEKSDQHWNAYAIHLILELTPPNGTIVCLPLNPIYICLSMSYRLTIVTSTCLSLTTRAIKVMWYHRRRVRPHQFNLKQTS